MPRLLGGSSGEVSRPRPEREHIPNVLPGDIVGFAGAGWGSAGINLATYGVPFWSLSHIGIIAEHQGEPLLFESTTLSDLPCVIRGRCCKGVQAHRLAERLATYHGRAWHYPLCRELYGFESRRLSDFLAGMLGRGYDESGAFRAGGIGFSFIESLLREQDLHSLFCSELCAAAHTTIGLFRTDNVSRWSPARFVRSERRQAILRWPKRLK